PAEPLLRLGAHKLQALGHSAAAASAIEGLGALSHARGDVDRARTLWLRALALARASSARLEAERIARRLVSTMAESNPERIALERALADGAPTDVVWRRLLAAVKPDG
ncbi:hypothetical protein L6R52_42110, partial [Myxococcota bacterium]|nr:hypothetical protein [Myxococcota bacterium]